jgi:hypothetical protein
MNGPFAGKNPENSDRPASCAVVVAVGPQPAEVERLHDLADAVAAWEPGGCWFVMVDDHPQPRELDKLIALPKPFRSFSLHHPRHGRKVAYRRGKGICSAILLALQWTQAHTDARFVLKLDTDSLVIGPFRDRLAALFRDQPHLGKVGAYDRTPGGTLRDISHHSANVFRLHKPPFEPLHPIRSIRCRYEEPLATIRRHISDAIANGYQYGEHCLGGGYALSRPLLDRMSRAGYLDDPSLWMSVDLPEDVMVGLYTRAAGMEMQNCINTGDVFGVRHVGLADTPEKLVSRGYAVIHAIKNDTRYSEQQLRDFYRALRPRDQGPNLRMRTA